MAIEPETAATKKGGGRSVGYPFIPLEDAINRARQFWEKEGKNLVPVSAAVKGWGYGDKSSGGKQTVAAMKHYGLLQYTGEGDTRKARLTDRALDILLAAPDSPKRAQAIKDAALAPKIYAGLMAQYPEGLPSDHSLGAHLLREKEFNRNAVDDFIKNFRATIQFAKITSSDTISPASNSNGQASNVKVGDFIQWESGGVVKFEARRVTGIADTKDFVFVEGSATGIPIQEVTIVEPSRDRSTDKTPPGVPPIKPPVVGARQDVFSLDEGQVILQWPAQLSAESYEDFESWIQLQLRKIKRSIQ